MYWTTCLLIAIGLRQTQLAVLCFYNGDGTWEDYGPASFCEIFSLVYAVSMMELQLQFPNKKKILGLTWFKIGGLGNQK